MLRRHCSGASAIRCQAHARTASSLPRIQSWNRGSGGRRPSWRHSDLFVKQQVPLCCSQLDISSYTKILKPICIRTLFIVLLADLSVAALLTCHLYRLQAARTGHQLNRSASNAYALVLLRPQADHIFAFPDLDLEMRLGCCMARNGLPIYHLCQRPVFRVQLGLLQLPSLLNSNAAVEKDLKAACTFCARCSTYKASQYDSGRSLFMLECTLSPHHLALEGAPCQICLVKPKHYPQFCPGNCQRQRQGTEHVTVCLAQMLIRSVAFSKRSCLSPLPQYLFAFAGSPLDGLRISSLHFQIDP